MGARRLPGVSDQDRTEIVNYSLSKINKGYFAIGEGNTDDECYSCVGLTEAAYDSAGQSIIPPLYEIPWITPWEQYDQTQPVNEITVRAGDLVEFNTKRVYWNPTEKQYIADSSVSIACPSGATCTGGQVSWLTTNAHIGENHLIFSANVAINGKTYYASQLLTIHVVGGGAGTISGRVVDATTGNGLSGATVSLDGTGRTASTDGAGNYIFSNVTAGDYTVSAQKTGYIGVSNSVTVHGNATEIVNFALPNAAFPNDIVVTLTWGSSPDDLDAHLWLPPASPYHIDWTNKGTLTSFPYAQLDVDDRNSYGPENVTIRQRFNGRYSYAVYNYSGEAAIATSSAKVTIVRGGSLVQTFTIPTIGDGRWWYVFDLDLNGGNGVIITRNFITDTNPEPYISTLDAQTTK
jgi:hypothetical protein